MAAHPDDITTEPDSKIVFNGPFNEKQTTHIKVTNTSDHQIGFAVKRTNPKRLGVDPASGILNPKEHVLITVSYDASVQEVINNDRVSIEWTATSGRQSARHEDVVGKKHGVLLATCQETFAARPLQYSLTFAHSLCSRSPHAKRREKNLFLECKL